MSDAKKIVDRSLTHEQLSEHMRTLAIAGAHLASAKELAVSSARAPHNEEARQEAIRMVGAANAVLQKVELAVEVREGAEAACNVRTSLILQFVRAQRKGREEILTLLGVS
jgi:hypothetical protein